MVSTSIKNRRFAGQARTLEWQREAKIHDLLKLAHESFALAKKAMKADVRHALTDVGIEYLEEAEKLIRAKFAFQTRGLITPRRLPTYLLFLRTIG